MVKRVGRDTAVRIDKRTATGIGCLVTIGIVLALMIVTFHAIARGDVPENPLTPVGVVLELVCAILTTSTYASVVFGSHSRRRFRSYFLWMLAINTIGLLSDVIYWGIGLDFLPALPRLRETCYFVCYASAFPLLIFYSTYLISYINEDSKELQRYTVLMTGLSADGFLLVMISVITSRSQNAPWHLSDHPWLYFFFLAMPMVVNIGIILNFRRMLTNRKAISFLFYELLVAAAVVVDTVIGEITLAHVVVAFCLIQIYITVQIEYEKQQEEQLLQQRISIMISQIQPHFLYNVLTSIRALCRIDAREAESALTDFTLYLRGNLDSLSNTGCIPFLQELQHTKHYVDLEKMRFGRDLTVLFNTPVTQFSLPPLTLEPIVENAVRHGVMQRLQGGTVIISTSETESDFVVTVSDDGIGFDAEQLAAGGKHIGLWNVRERLAAVCSGHMEIESGIDKGTNVTMCIPKYRKESE